MVFIQPKPISRLLIFGGNGFVGQAVAKAALSAGLEVIGLCRRGGVGDYMHDLNKHPEFSKMCWEKADLTQEPHSDQSWTKLIDHSTAVVSCVGMFSRSNEEMKNVNGYANISLAKTASEHGALRFVYVSAYPVENDLPFKLVPGYFEGKRLAESGVEQYFPNKRGVVLQPGMVYGTRIQNGTSIPLNLIGGPLETLFELPLIG